MVNNELELVENKLPTYLEGVIEKTREYIQQAKADNTLRAYRSDWHDFETWCNNQGVNPLPAVPQVVALYITSLVEQGLKVSTLQRRVTAISQAHQAAGNETPTKNTLVRSVLAGIKREKGIAQKGKLPVLTEDIRRMITALPDTLLGLRDRTLLLIGFCGAFRRSELVGLNAEDLSFTREGLVITLKHSKTDQEGQGRKIGIPYGSRLETCPVRTLQAWLEVSGITSGPVFRPINRHGQMQEGRLSDKAVALVVKRTAQKAGLNNIEQYAGHSLRAGLATSAAAAGASERAIMAQTGHRSVMMVRRYIRDGSLFRENAVIGLGL